METNWEKCKNKNITLADLMSSPKTYGISWEDPMPGLTEQGEEATTNVLQLMSIEDIVLRTRHALSISHPDVKMSNEGLLDSFIIVNWIDLSSQVILLS